MMHFTKEISEQPTLTFYNEKTKLIQSDIWSELKEGMWKEYIIDNRIYNDTLGEMRQTEWKSIFPNIHPIYSGFRWNEEKNCLEEDRYFPKLCEMSMKLFLKRAEDFFAKFDGKKIGVHLSGGLDSSLVICLLHHFSIPFNLYGFATNRFEFRTERRIQEILLPLGKKSVLIDIDEHLFFTDLDDFPAHQIPDSYIKQIKGDRKMVDLANKDGVEIMLTGQGADTLFVDAGVKGLSYNIGNEFEVPWSKDLIYRPKGIELVPFYGDKSIIEAIYNLRLGEKEDALKKWARYFFRDFLPCELSKFTFVADFFGISMSGLEEAKPTVSRLFEKAYELVKHPLFSPENTREMLETNVFDLKYETYSAYCNKIAIAVWLDSIIKRSYE